MSMVSQTPGAAGPRLPCLFEPSGATTALPEFVAGHVSSIRGKLLEHGAVLLRGFAVKRPEDFGEFITALGMKTLNYTYRSTPRTSRGPGLYTATEYPAAREIPLHNENSYQRVWPRKLAFCCLRAASAGGATPLADMRAATRSVDRQVLDKFRRLGVRYDRVFHAHIDLSWQDAFQTQDRGEVERFCEENGIQHAWLEDDVLKTSQVCPGVVRHDESDEEFLFNQAHLFHPSALGERTLQHMLEAFGRELLPRNAFYGNGEEIGNETLQTLRVAYAQAAFDLDWLPGDVALIDNVQVAHGRRSYSGERQVLAALLEPNLATGQSAHSTEAA